MSNMSEDNAKAKIVWLPQVCALYGYMHCVMAEPNMAIIDVVDVDELCLESILFWMIQTGEFDVSKLKQVLDKISDSDVFIDDEIWGPVTNLVLDA